MASADDAINLKERTMSQIYRCDAPACTAKTTNPVTAGWLMGNNKNGFTVHAHTAAHLTDAVNTTGDPNAAAIV